MGIVLEKKRSRQVTTHTPSVLFSWKKQDEWKHQALISRKRFLGIDVHDFY